MAFGSRDLEVSPGNVAAVASFISFQSEREKPMLKARPEIVDDDRPGADEARATSDEGPTSRPNAPPSVRSTTIFDLTCAVLELDDRLTRKKVAYEERALRLARLRVILGCWASGATATEHAEDELLALLVDANS